MARTNLAEVQHRASSREKQFLVQSLFCALKHNKRPQKVDVLMCKKDLQRFLLVEVVLALKTPPLQSGRARPCARKPLTPLSGLPGGPSEVFVHFLELGPVVASSLGVIAEPWSSHCSRMFLLADFSNGFEILKSLLGRKESLSTFF